MSKLEKSNGLRTAVKLGEISASDALLMLADIKKNGGFVNDTIVRWLKKRVK